MLELYTYIMSLELYTMNRLNIFLDPYVDLFHQLYRKIFSLHKSKCTFNCQLPQMKISTSAWSEGMLNEWWIFSMNILVDSIKTFVFLQNLSLLNWPWNCLWYESGFQNSIYRKCQTQSLRNSKTYFLFRICRNWPLDKNFYEDVCTIMYYTIFALKFMLWIQRILRKKSIKRQ